ncbi:uncharacterized protein LOC112399506 isoform X2 [Neophocaena asiaeorientalis asiaeorientalis]|uniref:Uncharacterized protein LOC112399506 isoform X2 n=1 Tax=Neophocaena asiaeorientalis asiaeorientalis TaxID=1706337 RepID=A0A341BFL2_NEOAA|nr:uncharacterized protein LOC112399506 isoform X2 [Neophocaena asiaeorientalis asiaeorientalis]XP_024600483.1 uncharacterized protein LOC112399506 isoform X2 [Neophocaena asiaeorientalis asiaeorientalis]
MGNSQCICGRELVLSNTGHQRQLSFPQQRGWPHHDSISSSAAVPANRSISPSVPWPHKRFRPEARLGNLSTTRCSSGPHTWLAQQAQQMSNKCVYRFRGAPAVADGESSFLGVWHRCIRFFTKEPTILILAPRPRKPTPPAVGAQSLNHWIARMDHPPADLGAENQSIFFSKTEGVLEGRKQPCTLCRGRDPEDCRNPSYDTEIRISKGIAKKTADNPSIL